VHQTERERRLITTEREREDRVFDRGLIHLNVMVLAVESLMTAPAAPAMVIAV
jgi:hypothetical protein